MKDNTRIKNKPFKPIPKGLVASLKHRSKDSILHPMKPEQEIILLKDLLGNFSDQTGASFG